MNLYGNERKYLLDAFDSGWLTHRGSYEERFERAFSKYCGLPALATSSGTGALHLALLSNGIGPGDEVILPALTFGATASVVLAVGAKPVFVDVEDNACMADFRHAVTRRTAAVMPVNLYGESVSEEIHQTAKDLGLKVIEDNCEGLGFVSPRGDVSAYSFYANKVMTTGEGGMLVGNLGLAEQYRNGGFDSDYYHEVPGLNYRAGTVGADRRAGSTPA
jgi:perosamine synthetase